MTDTVRWFDHQGNVVEAPAPPEGQRSTAYRWDDQYTHYMFGQAIAVPMFQAMTLCGKRALEVPGRGEVTCTECIEAAA